MEASNTRAGVKFAPHVEARAMLTIICGGDALTRAVCEELTAAEQRVTVLWYENAGLAADVERAGGRYVAGDPTSPAVLRAAGVAEATTIMALDTDDRINLEVGLQAREINPAIRVSMRQFNRGLGRKLEQNLRGCRVLSLASHAAATFAAAAAMPSCFYALEFPEYSNTIRGFARRTAAEWGVASQRRAQAELALGATIVSPRTEEIFAPEDELVVFGEIAKLASLSTADRRAHARGGPLVGAWQHLQNLAGEIDPVLGIILAFGSAIIFAASILFAFALHLDPITALYFVVTTMTTVGYGDISLADKGGPLKVAGMTIMFAGVLIANLTVAFISAALVRAQLIALQGLRQIHRRHHIVVFGAGRVGMRVIEYLRALRVHLVVVDQVPSAAILRLGRRRGIDVLTGDATSDDTLEMCNVAHARSVVVLTDSDATNLEVGLGVRAIDPEMPVIMRIADAQTAHVISRQFAIRRTFSASALAAPVFARFASEDNVRGHLHIDGRAFIILESEQPPASAAAPLMLASAGGQTLYLCETP